MWDDGNPSDVRVVALVGNEPTYADRSSDIDGADRVIRFNNAFGFGAQTGSRTDDLFLVNHGGQAREWLDDPGFEKRPHIAATRRIILPFHSKDPTASSDADIDGADHSRALTERLMLAGKSVRMLDPMVVASARNALGIATGPSADLTPSTGFLAIFHYWLGLPATTRIVLHGFGFAGWEGHPWAAERRWAEGHARTGRLIWKPQDATS